MAQLCSSSLRGSQAFGLRTQQPRAGVCRANGRVRVVKTQALFGWGKKDDDKEWAKEEQFRMQQELLEARKNGTYIKDANERRAKVAATLAERKAARRSERDALARGEVPASYRDWKPYEKKEDADGTGGIIVPLLPFGMRKYDEGERFDLRSPYSDDGWVDPDEVDMWGSFKKIGDKLLDFGGVGKKLKKEAGREIVWASQYEKTMAERKQAKLQQQQNKKK